jgi:hypothetical protein
MPLQKLQFRPGINREGTTLSNEGGWYYGDKIRFRSGQVEKLGGWVIDNGLVITGGNMIGVIRSLWNWIGLNSYNYMGIGTNQKFYIQNGTGGNEYDITPVRYVAPAGNTTFAATAGSSVIRVTDAGHGAQTGDWVTFTNAASLGGNVTAAILNANAGATTFTTGTVNTGGGYQVTYVSSSQFDITVPVVANSSDTGNGGASVIATYQITTGSAIYTTNPGWGAGGWSGITTGYASTGWGSPASAGLGIGTQLRLWSQANFGQNLLINPRGGPIYYWVVDGASPNVYNIAQILSSTNNNLQNGTAWWLGDTDTPLMSNYILVSDASRFTIAFGTNDYGSSVQNPMLIRWSDQESVLTWTPAVTNQAGSYLLSHGSTIVSALQSRQEILVFTDAALYSMQYLGAPYVWGFQLLADNISIVAPNAATTVNNVTYWMGQDKFYMYSGRVETLPCTLREYIFQDINMAQSSQFFAGTNEGFNEVWWFYCSTNSNYIDRYVIYNHLERIWYYGNLSRTAWLDSALRATPTAASYVVGSTTYSTLIYHEQGVNNGETNPPTAINSFIQSSDFDIGDGHNFGFVWRIIPDVSFNGSTSAAPSLNFTVLPRQNPGSGYGQDDNPSVVSTQNYQNQRTYEVQQFSEYAYVRMRGRQMAFKIQSNKIDVQWQLGVPRIDIRPDGRR